MSFLRRGRAFYGFFVSYSLILMIPLCTWIVAFYLVPRSVERQERQANLALLERASDSVGSNLLEVERMVQFIAEDPLVRRFAMLPPLREGGDYYELYRLIENLRGYQYKHPFIQGFHLFFRNSGRVVADGASYEIGRFYDTYFTYAGLTFEEWKALFVEATHEGDYLRPAEAGIGLGRYQVITYIRSFPEVSPSNPTIVVWVLIQVDTIKRFLSTMSPLGSSGIYDSSGRIVVPGLGLREQNSHEGLDASALRMERGFLDQRMGGQRMIVSYTTSAQNGWKYVSVVPRAAVMVEARFIRILLAGIGLVVLLIGLLTAYLLSLRNVRPLRELVEVMRERGIPFGYRFANEYEIIKGSMKELFQLSESLKQEIRAQLPILRAGFFERLLQGQYPHDEAVHAVLDHLGFSIPGERFLVVLARINVLDSASYQSRFQELLKARLIFSGVMARRAGQRVAIHDRAEHEIVLLLGFPAAQTASWRRATEDLLRPVHEELLGEYHMNVSFSAGTLSHRLSDVWHSFREAVESSDAIKVSTEFAMNWFEDRNELRRGYYYPPSIEERIINNVRSGNDSEVQQILTLLHRENFESRRLTRDSVQMLTSDLRCTVVKILDAVDLQDEHGCLRLAEKLKSLSHRRSAQEVFEDLRQILRMLCEAVDQRKKSHKKELVESMKSYIRQKLGELGLNRYWVASHFGMTEAYFSSFFKEQAGMCFSDFVAAERIARALELLGQDRLPWHRIASEVGYGNPKTFRRAFKKIHGINPVEYRSIARSG